MSQNLSKLNVLSEAAENPKSRHNSTLTVMKDYHEPTEEMDEETRSRTRALNSLKEEIEAVDWYNQRIDVEVDDSLRKILKHNMEEEMEHACMTLEWLRRNMDGWDEQLKTYLFTEGEIGD